MLSITETAEGKNKTAAFFAENSATSIFAKSEQQQQQGQQPNTCKAVNESETTHPPHQPTFCRVPLQHHSEGYLQFGDYKLMQTLGEGEFGKVKLAIDGNGQEFAVKFIKKSLLTNPEFKSKLYREIEVMQVHNFQ
jgi:hypothetical protein